MTRDRDNQGWVDDLRAGGAQRNAALADLRGVLAVGLRAALRSRPDFLDSMLDDILQDALLRVLAALDQFQGRSRFVTWATAVGVRVGMGELRKRKWRDVSLEALVADANFEPPAAEDVSPERRELVEAMDRVIRTGLTEKQRTVLLAEMRGMAQDEIARQMGTNRNALYKLSHDARMRLKRGLEEAGFGPESLSALQ